MRARRLSALLLAAFVSGCSALTPFATAPLAPDPKDKTPGARVAICYNPLKTPPEKLQELGQAQCIGDTVAEKVGTDYRLDDCPVLTPGRATFVCKPKPKPESPPSHPFK
jgi:hypothetical protein